jgi:peptide/nickel transport system permease protein
MGTYVLRRFLALLIVLLGVSFIAFYFVHLIPGDPAVTLLGERATTESIARVREQLGLNDPLPIQYARFLGRLVTGDLGRSIRTNNPVGDEFGTRFPATVELTLVAMFLAVVVGVPAGVFAAIRRNSIFDILSTSLALVGISMPIYWLGLMLVWFFAIQLKIFPPGGRIDSDIQLQTITNYFVIDSIVTGNWQALGNVLQHLVLPAVALSTVPMAIIARMTRSAVLEVLGQDYVRTARAKGLVERAVITRHVLQNAALPIVTVVGLEVGLLLGGAVLTESIFSWPGIGRWIYDAVQNRDYPVIQAMIMVIAGIFVAVNLIVDLLYAALDPRIRLF